MDVMNTCLVFTVLLMGAPIIVALLIFVIRRLVLNPRQALPTADDSNQVSFHLQLDDITVAVRILVIPRDAFRRDSYAEFRVPWPDQSFRCEVYPTNDPTQSRQLPGMDRLDTGVTDSGRHFEVQSNDINTVDKLLSDTVQEQINRLFWHGGTDDIHLSVAGGMLVVRKLNPYNARDKLEQFAQMFVLLREQMLVAVECGIEVIHQSLDGSFDDAVCGICGELIESDAVTCRRCKTPHHRDCWEYFGACSIYACGETEFATGTAPIHLGLRPQRIPRPRSRWHNA